MALNRRRRRRKPFRRPMISHGASDRYRRESSSFVRPLLFACSANLRLAKLSSARSFVVGGVFFFRWKRNEEIVLLGARGRYEEKEEEDEEFCGSLGHIQSTDR